MVKTTWVSIACLAGFLLFGCQNPNNTALYSKRGSDLSANTVTVDVPFEQQSRSLFTDENVLSVSVAVTNPQAVLVGSGVLTKQPEGWKGQISLSSTGLLTFSVRATGVSQKALYGGVVTQLVNTDSAVTVPVLATTLRGGAIQGAPLSLSATVSSLAGYGFNGADGVGAAARLGSLYGIASDGVNLYVADAGNRTIRKVVISTRAVTTIAGTVGLSGSVDGTGASARFMTPSGIASDGTNLYVTDYGSGTIRKVVIATGVVTTLAGVAGLHGNNDGVGTGATFNNPWGIATCAGNLYVADPTGRRIRKIVIETGEVSTFAGDGYSTGSRDGIGSDARFSTPMGLATDGTSLFVADSENHTIRRILIATQEVTTLAGLALSSGSTDNTGPAARFNYPTGLATDGTSLFVSDSNNHTIRQIVIATGVVTTFAGSPYDSSAGLVDGVGGSARFSSSLKGLATDGTTLYISDSANYTIRSAVIATRTVTTLAGSANIEGFADGNGNAARFKRPKGITTDGTDLYVADWQNGSVRKVNIATGGVTTLVQSVYGLSGITTDGSSLYWANAGDHTILTMGVNGGAVTTLAGNEGYPGSEDATGIDARFSQPTDLTTDGTNLYVADTGNHTIRQIVIATGAVTTLAGAAGSSGSADGTGSEARFDSPKGITTDGTYLYVADSMNYSIRRVVIATGATTTLAGGSGLQGLKDGVGAAATFADPRGITMDSGNLYVADHYTAVIRKVVIATGRVTTLAGAWASDSVDAQGSDARFNQPLGLTSDGTSLFVADEYNHTIRRIQ